MRMPSALDVIPEERRSSPPLLLFLKTPRESHLLWGDLISVPAAPQPVVPPVSKKLKNFLGEFNIKGRYKMLKENVARVLEEIRPHLQADGGDVELVNVEEGVVKVKFLGGCSGCPFRAMTLQTGIERYLKERLPEVKEVISV